MVRQHEIFDDSNVKMKVVESVIGTYNTSSFRSSIIMLAYFGHTGRIIHYSMMFFLIYINTKFSFIIWSIDLLTWLERLWKNEKLWLRRNVSTYGLNYLLRQNKGWHCNFHQIATIAVDWRNLASWIHIVWKVHQRLHYTILWQNDFS